MLNVDCMIAEEEGRRGVFGGRFRSQNVRKSGETGSSELFGAFKRLSSKFEQVRANSSKSDQILATISCFQSFSGATFRRDLSGIWVLGDLRSVVRSPLYVLM